MKTKIIIATVFFVGACFCLILVYRGNLTSETAGIFANLGTGFIGTAFTVLIVDWLYERREIKSLMPKRIVAHEDVRLLVTRTFTFWYSAYMASVPGELPKSISDLLEKDSIQKILENLDLNSEANVTPRQIWWNFLPSQLQDLRNLAENILQRYNGILDPTAYILVNELAHRVMDPNFSKTLRISDAEHSYPRLQVLGSYIVITEEYFPSLLKLVKWCNAEAETISRLSGIEVKKIDEMLRGVRKDGTPPCMIDPISLARQVENLNRYKRQNAA